MSEINQRQANYWRDSLRKEKQKHQQKLQELKQKHQQELRELKQEIPQQEKQQEQPKQEISKEKPKPELNKEKPQQEPQHEQPAEADLAAGGVAAAQLLQRASCPADPTAAGFAGQGRNAQ